MKTSLLGTKQIKILFLILLMSFTMMVSIAQVQALTHNYKYLSDGSIIGGHVGHYLGGYSDYTTEDLDQLELICESTGLLKPQKI